jgi:hypothetical protein
VPCFPCSRNRAVAQSGPIDELSRPQSRQAVIGPINREVERLNLGALNFHLLTSFPQFAVKASNIATLQGRCRKPDHCRGRVRCRSTSCALRQSTLVLLGPYVWTGRALQAESDDLEMIGLAHLYPALERNVCVPGPVRPQSAQS